MTREEWLWMRASVALVAAAVRAMRLAEGQERFRPGTGPAPR